MSRLLRLLVLIGSLGVALVLVGLSISVQPDLLWLAYIVGFIVLPVLNILANIIQITEFFKGEGIGKTAEHKMKLGEELFTPLLLEIERILADLKDQNTVPTRIDLPVWTEKSSSYLFLSLHKDEQKKIRSFYVTVAEYNSLLNELFRIVEYQISDKMYKFSEGFIVPPVDWDSEYLNGFNSVFDKHCKEEAKRLAPSVCRTLIYDANPMKNLWVLSNPFYASIEADEIFFMDFQSQEIMRKPV